MDLEIGQKVAIIIGTETALGFTVLIEESMEGLVYKNEVFSDLEEGVSTTGYIKNIREDGKIDVSMRPLGYRNTIEDDNVKILHHLDQNNGTYNT